MHRQGKVAVPYIHRRLEFVCAPQRVVGARHLCEPRTTPSWILFELDSFDTMFATYYADFPSLSFTLSPCPCCLLDEIFLPGKVETQKRRRSNVTIARLQRGKITLQREKQSGLSIKINLEIIIESRNIFNIPLYQFSEDTSDFSPAFYIVEKFEISLVHIEIQKGGGLYRVFIHRVQFYTCSTCSE